jgi:hypothetical protein
MLGAMLVLSGMLLVGYISPRYTIEFLPALTIACAAAVPKTIDFMQSLRTPSRGVAFGAVALLATFSFAANASVAVTTARTTAGGDALRSLVRIQSRIASRTGVDLDSYVDTSHQVDSYSQPDRVRIIGDCDAMYFGTGDLYRPWIPLEINTVRVRVLLRGGHPAGGVELIRFDGFIDRSVYLDFDERGRYRMRVSGARSQAPEGPWRDAAGGTEINLVISANLEGARYRVFAVDHLLAAVPMYDRLPDLRLQPAMLRSAVADDNLLKRFGVEVSVRRDAPSDLCIDLLGG